MITGKQAFMVFLIFIAIGFVTVFSTFAFSSIKATQTANSTEANVTGDVISAYDVISSNYDVLGIVVLVVVVLFFAGWIYKSVSK